MIDKLDATCEQYGMAMNAKKTKTMIVEKTPEKQCEVNVKGQRLTQVKQYKYLGTTVENTGQCKTEVANRINQAKIAFWKKATLLRSNIDQHKNQNQNSDVLCVLSGIICGHPRYWETIFNTCRTFEDNNTTFTTSFVIL